jgi:hypothetical protein
VSVRAVKASPLDFGESTKALDLDGFGKPLETLEIGQQVPVGDRSQIFSTQ